MGGGGCNENQKYWNIFSKNCGRDGIAGPFELRDVNKMEACVVVWDDDDMLDCK